MAKPGLYANIHAKRKRIAAGSGEKMRKAGAPGAPTNSNFKRAAKTAKKNKLKIKTTRGVPKYLYNLDKERYGDQYRTIKKIEKAKKKKKKNKRTA